MKTANPMVDGRTLTRRKVQNENQAGNSGPYPRIPDGGPPESSDSDGSRRCAERDGGLWEGTLAARSGREHGGALGQHEGGGEGYSIPHSAPTGADGARGKADPRPSLATSVWSPRRVSSRRGQAESRCSFLIFSVNTTYDISYVIR